jgi:flagellar biosynthesis protein FlhA
MTGVETTEPAFALPAIWIPEDQRATAEHRNYTVVEPTSVLATHLTELLRTHAAELLTRQDVSRLIDNLKERSPKLVEELIPDQIKMGEVQAVLHVLLRERVPVRDLETVLETLGDWASRTKDPEVLAEYVRNALARTICENHRDQDNTIHAVTLDPAIEDTVNAHVERSERGAYLTLPPALANKVISAIRTELETAAAKTAGQQPVILASPQVRLWIRRLIESTLPNVAVLGYNEIVRGVNVRTHAMVAMTDGVENVPSPVNV